MGGGKCLEVAQGQKSRANFITVTFPSVFSVEGQFFRIPISSALVMPQCLSCFFVFELFASPNGIRPHFPLDGTKKSVAKLHSSTVPLPSELVLQRWQYVALAVMKEPCLFVASKPAGTAVAK
jgi:hypothetical protein